MAGSRCIGAQRERLPVNGVPAEEFVGSLAGEDHRDMFGGITCDEIERHDCRIGNGIVQMPYDRRQGRHDVTRVNCSGDGCDPEVAR